MKSPRDQYPVFTYERFETEMKGNDLVVRSFFRTEPDLTFCSLNTFKDISESVDLSLLDTFAFHIGLSQLFSYWKATCSPVIRIAAGKLTSAQMNWWHDLLVKGMGEYFHVNRMDFTQPDFVRIESASEKIFPLASTSVREHALVPIGGGKDSAVTLELFRRNGIPFTGFMINPTPAMKQLSALAGDVGPIVVERTLDPKLFELNSRGFYNGHVPFSASIAFVSLCAAFLTRSRYIVVSNEASANTETTQYLGHAINHQYSKTHEFEKKFREYVKRYMSPDIEYFSLMRPLNELRIARLFSGMPQYFSAFRSCNRGQKTNSWCGECPKCLSTFILLYPFVGKDINRIFPDDLFAKESLVPILESLVDSSKTRPFECVGTREELLVALALSVQKTENLPILLKFAREQYLSHEQDIEGRTKRLLSAWDEHHFLPERFEMVLKGSSRLGDSLEQ